MDKSVKLALDSNVLNKAIHKNRYQLLNIGSLIDSISQHINDSNHGDNVYFSTIDLKYAYSQLIWAYSFPTLLKICHPLRPLLKKSEKFIWTDNHQKHFEYIETVIANATENTHFNPTLETRIKCNASRQG